MWLCNWLPSPNCHTVKYIITLSGKLYCRCLWYKNILKHTVFIRSFQNRPRSDTGTILWRILDFMKYAVKRKNTNILLAPKTELAGCWMQVFHDNPNLMKSKQKKSLPSLCPSKEPSFLVHFLRSFYWCIV